ncbi:unnamed protein product [Rotaria sp. Silwood1]|nr:unnamed protein product [Rotaria sp. Silwood1]CAF3432381.1 unnamed protein product [Rotaria sp. Silwood1]CAF5033909.1 unnamed protein product [Rotaria sp. Silwood1]
MENMCSDGMLVRYWYQRWDGTQESLVGQQKSHKQRHRIVNDSHRYILRPVLKAIEKRKKIHILIYIRIFRKKPLLNISLRTVRYYGNSDWNLRWKKTKQRLEIEEMKILF